MQKSQAISLKKQATRRRFSASLSGPLDDEEAGFVESTIDAAPSNVPLLASITQSASPYATGPVPSYATDLVAVKEIMRESWINLLLLAAPFGFAAPYLGWNAMLTFTLNFITLIPLALILGDVTEDLALRFGETIGGLINATFGNVVEMILSIAALREGLFTIVATSLLGSILSNLLLVLGFCFFAGGLKYSTQTFNSVSNRATSALLFLACIGLIIPTACSSFGGPTLTGDEVLWISRASAVILLIIYMSYLYFQLVSHANMFQAEEGEEQPMMTLVGAFTFLLLITIAVAACSENVAMSIEEFSKVTGVGEAFLGMIVLPIAGNAAEHLTAVVVASKNKMDLALGVAVGSSVQIAIFAIPFAVVVGWAMGLNFSLSFDPFAVIILTASVVLVNVVTADAVSHWLMGVFLIATYVMIAIAFLFR